MDFIKLRITFMLISAAMFFVLIGIAFGTLSCDWRCM